MRNFWNEKYTLASSVSYLWKELFPMKYVLHGMYCMLWMYHQFNLVDENMRRTKWQSLYINIHFVAVIAFNKPSFHWHWRKFYSLWQDCNVDWIAFHECPRLECSFGHFSGALVDFTISFICDILQREMLKKQLGDGETFFLCVCDYVSNR